MIGRSDRCFSPWVGYLVILIVCIVIAGAVFFETRGSAARRRARHVHRTPQTAVQPVPMAPSTAGTTADGKVLF